MYGLRLAAPWFAAEPTPDLTIRIEDEDTAEFRHARGLVPRTLRSRPFSYQKLDYGRRYVCWRRLIEGIIDPNNKQVVLRQLGEGGLDTFRSHLLSPVLALVLLDRGQETLHGSAISFGDQAIAILGDSGAGKSSLAAALLSAGGRCITDDLLVLSGNDRVHVLPGPARLKLYPATAEQLLPGLRSSIPLNPFTTKRVYALHSSEAEPRALRLAGFWLLTGGAQTRRLQTRLLSGSSAVQALVASTFVTVDDTVERQARLLRFAARLASVVPVHTLTLPRGLQRLTEQSASIVRALIGLAA
ncbi:MAG: hypothetical protein WEE89_19440 [Gemmatimonadota bacterium]